MNKRMLLAAELNNYSYANYENHLGIGNARFETMMPKEVDILQRAEKEGWASSKIASKLNITEAEVAELQKRYAQAKDIVEAPNPAESFRRGVRYSILAALDEGLKDEDDIDSLVGQICYRAADLAYLLDLEEADLSDYSEELR